MSWTTCVELLDALGWDGLSLESRDIVGEAVARVHQDAALLTALAASEKHLRAARRAVKAETRQRYAQQAEDELAAALPQITLPEVRRKLEDAIRLVRSGR